MIYYLFQMFIYYCLVKLDVFIFLDFIYVWIFILKFMYFVIYFICFNNLISLIAKLNAQVVFNECLFAIYILFFFWSSWFFLLFICISYNLVVDLPIFFNYWISPIPFLFVPFGYILSHPFDHINHYIIYCYCLRHVVVIIVNIV